jgi:ribosomal protein S18 acetylase RimI-like enzyme
VEIVRLAPGDDERVRAAQDLFDGPARAEATARFLASDTHHMLVAYEDEAPVGFVSGMEITHPDKGTEMFLYELSVAEPARRRGIGRALVHALGELAQEHGRYDMFVLTDDANTAAQATYAAGASREAGLLMYVWNPPA